MAPDPPFNFPLVSEQLQQLYKQQEVQQQELDWTCLNPTFDFSCQAPTPSQLHAAITLVAPVAPIAPIAPVAPVTLPHVVPAAHINKNP